MHTVVKAHAARGAIKAGRIDSWVSRLTASEGQARDELLADLTALADNPALAATQGSPDGGEAEGGDPRSELMNKAIEKVQASANTDKAIDIRVALEQAKQENPDLAASAAGQGKARVAQLTASDDQFKAAGVNRG